MDKETPPKRRTSQSAPAPPQPGETVVRLPLTDLHPFKGYPALQDIMPRNQPYLVRDDDPTMIQLVARVKERGVTYPGVVRPDPKAECDTRSRNKLLLEAALSIWGNPTTARVAGNGGVGSLWDNVGKLRA